MGGYMGIMCDAGASGIQRHQAERLLLSLLPVVAGIDDKSWVVDTWASCAMQERVGYTAAPGRSFDVEFAAGGVAATCCTGTSSFFLHLCRSWGSLHSHAASNDLGSWCSQGPNFLHTADFFSSRDFFVDVVFEAWRRGWRRWWQSKIT